MSRWCMNRRLHDRDLARGLRRAPPDARSPRRASPTAAAGHRPTTLRAMPAQQIARNLAFVNWTVARRASQWARSARSSCCACGPTRRRATWASRRSAPRRSRGLAWLSDGALPALAGGRLADHRGCRAGTSRAVRCSRCSRSGRSPTPIALFRGARAPLARDRDAGGGDRDARRRGAHLGRRRDRVRARSPSSSSCWPPRRVGPSRG